MNQRTHSEIENDHQNYGYITSGIRTQSFLRAVQNKSVIELCRLYGLNLIRKNQHVIEKKLFEEIKDTSVREIIRLYDFSLLKGFEDFINQKLLKETTNMSWEEIYSNYNADNQFWKLFEQGILLGPNFRDKAQSELEQHDIVYMVRKYSANIFKYHILDPHVLKPAVYKAIFSQVTFVEYQEKFASGLSIPLPWDQKAAELGLELRYATTDHNEAVPGKFYSNGQAVHKWVYRQDDVNLMKTKESINERWNTFLAQTNEDS